MFAGGRPLRGARSRKEVTLVYVETSKSAKQLLWISDGAAEAGVTVLEIPC